LLTCTIHNLSQLWPESGKLLVTFRKYHRTQPARDHLRDTAWAQGIQYGQQRDYYTSNRQCTCSWQYYCTIHSRSPPVPNMLVKRIQEGEFVNISELTVDSLSMAQGDESSKSNHSKKCPVTSIIEWAQYFTNYIAILSQAKPKRTLDLRGINTYYWRLTWNIQERDG